jgi:hypothetical protein
MPSRNSAVLGFAALPGRSSVLPSVPPCFRIGQREGSHHEDVVAVVAFEPEHGLVGVDSELVVALPALGHQRRALLPADSQPRVVAIGGEDIVGARRFAAALRWVPYSWPIWKLSSPWPPSRVVIALLSSVAKLSLPPCRRHFEPAVDGSVVVDALHRRVVARLDLGSTVPCSRPTKAGRLATSLPLSPAMAVRARSRKMSSVAYGRPVAGSMPFLAQSRSRRSTAHPRRHCSRQCRAH